MDLRYQQNYNVYMPCTPYHFGPSALIGYIFRKWIDLPVFVFANIIVDVEVLLVNFLHLGRPCHRLGHTLLIGAVVGAAWGFVAYLGLPIISWSMKIIRIPYQTNVFKIIISGITGVWFHVLIDGIYHYDVKPFWPIQKNYLWRLLSKNHVKLVCIICLVIFLILYAVSLKKQFSNKR
ncbi:MAG: hypothetical protein JW806_01565 [Sedimentisphaerales bacterium]|nr:hypothetical protein [Sedimentisphaerales bacterium]